MNFNQSKAWKSHLRQHLRLISDLRLFVKSTHGHLLLWNLRYRTNAEFSTIQTDPETKTRTINKNKTLQLDSVRFHLSLTYFALEISSHHALCSLNAKNALLLYWCRDLKIISSHTRSLYILPVFHRSKTQYYQLEIQNPHDTITKKSIFLVHLLQFKIILFSRIPNSLRVWSIYYKMAFKVFRQVHNFWGSTKLEGIKGYGVR